MKRVFHAFAMVLVLGACSTPTSPYDRLCAIYADYAPKPVNDAMQEMAIYDRVKRELPEIMPIYDVVVQNGPGDRYEVLRDAARKEKPNWECEVLRKRWVPSAR